MTIDISKNSLLYLCICDVMVALFIITIPIIAHLSPMPLYIFEPMRIAIFATLILLPNKKTNAIIMALLLPILSYTISGHPIAVKNVLIAIELVANVLLFHFFLSKFKSAGVSMFFSIITSKILYYGMKYICLSIGLLSIGFVSTSIKLQLIVATIISALFSLWYKR